MIVGTGSHRYEWIDGWAQVPDSAAARAGWAHHGVVVTADDEVVTYHPGDPVALVFDSSGRFVRSWRTDLTEAHGMSLSTEGGREYLWIADPGAKRDPALGYAYPPGPRKGQASKITLDGKLAMRIGRPETEAYRSGQTYSPTSVTVFQESQRGNGDIWIADGYGQNLVHRYSKGGEYIASISGSEGEAGAFSCPHAVFVDSRKDVPELYIADRTNRRIQVYDLEGNFKRTFGADFLTSPSAFAVDGDQLLVAELRARITIIDASDRLVGYLGENESVCAVEGWPNMKDSTGQPVRPGHLTQGKFNSPHGIAVDRRGDIYVVEWLIGGRYTKLRRAR